MKCPHCPRTLDTGDTPGAEACERCHAYSNPPRHGEGDRAAVEGATGRDFLARPPVLLCLTVALATMLLIRIAISLFDAIGHGLP